MLFRSNYGPHQHDEKLIPTVIRSAMQSKNIPIYGKGENIRDWLFVKDHCSAIETVFNEGKAGETYNIGGNNEWKNIDLVHKICEILNKVVGTEEVTDDGVVIEPGNEEVIN